MIKKRLIICLLIVLSVILQGCGKQSEQNEEVGILSKERTYEGEDIVLQGLEGEVQQSMIRDDELYLLMNQEGATHFYKSSTNGSKVEEIPISLLENEKVNCFYIDQDNMISMNEMGNQIELVKQSIAGDEIGRIDIKEQLALTETNLLNDVLVDGNGNIILADPDMVYVLDSALQLIKKISVKEQYKIITFARTKTGSVAFGLQKENSYGGGTICMLDAQTGEWGSFLQMTMEEPQINETCLMDGEVYDLYYGDAGGIFGYSVAEKAWTTILDARCSLLTVGDIEGMIGATKESFLGLLKDSYSPEEGVVVTCYSKLNPEELENKKVITYAGYNVPNKLRTVARQFNKTHKDCRVEIQLYEDEEGTRLAFDIGAGKAPDIFMIEDGTMPIEQWIKKGILEDLTPYYEADAEIHTEDMIPSVLEGMKVNGRLYYVSPYFTVISAACRASDAKGREGWTIQEMNAILKEKGEETIAFETLDKEEMLYDFLFSNLNNFINWDTGECDFCSQEFKDILEFCNGGILTEQMTEGDYEALWTEIEKKMEEGNVLLYFCGGGVTLNEIQWVRQKFGTDIKFIGLPEKDRQGSYFRFTEPYGIYAGSDVKQEAWDFIKMVMSEEYQINVNHIHYGILPTRKDALEWKLQAQMAKTAFEDSYGNWIEPKEPDVWYTSSGEERRMEVPSQADADLLWDLVNRTKKRVLSDADAESIIMEEAEAYFHGEKTLDKVANTIQKRMTTYVNEQK